MILLQGWVVVSVALVYLGVLFAVASYGDHVRPAWMTGPGRPYIYALSLGVYCTSWTFFGSVGLASTTGLDFLTIYIGPMLLIGVGSTLVARVVRLAKAQNITSIADFIAARYGKSQRVAAAVSIAAVIGTIPYIALQLKAISTSLATVLDTQALVSQAPWIGDLSLLVALLLAAFAILFGTRHVDATEHQDGLMLAIAMESVVKLVAFLGVGSYVTWVMFDGPGDLFRAAEAAGLHRLFEKAPAPDVWLTMTSLAFVCAILLPRQFHVTVVENRDEREVRRAAWLFPAYLVAINVFVVPIALAGLLTSGSGRNPDMYVLALPLEHGAGLFALAAFVGGLSAATAMVIVESVALAIMVSNEIAVPLLLRRREADRPDMGRLLLAIRRAAIFAILLLAYLYYRAAGAAALAQIGLLSFAAIAQFAPAFLGALFWRKATARGALAGLAIGFAAWAYTLLLPSFAASGLLPDWIVTEGPFGLGWLRPQALFGLDLDPLAHGVLWSLALNATAFVLGSTSRAPTAMERLQANAFAGGEAPMAQSFRGWRTPVTVGELTQTVARYLGEERARASFESFAQGRGTMPDPGQEADIHLLRFAEHLLASAIGAASSRLVLSLLLRRGNVSTTAALRLLDDASAAIQYSRDLLQTALDHAKQGITVADKDLRLACWNREFIDLFDIPAGLLRVGTGLDEIIRFNAERGLYGPGSAEDHLADRLERIVTRLATFRTRLHPSGRVIEIRSNRMPDGGTVTTYTDVTESVRAEEELGRANETLEGRVGERTRELTRLNQELAQAKAEADDANVSKTRFLAAASHDILQPLNAARLYVSSLVERAGEGAEAELIGNADASLEAVEEILSALLDISRLDAGAMKPEPSSFRLGEVLRQLEVEFAPLAREQNVRLAFMPTTLSVRSDRRLVRRLLQNLVSNAVKYSPRGRVLVGCRRAGDRVRVEIWDTGLGIPPSKRKAIFREFQRLDQGAKVARGLGLGLSIVERIARVLDAPIALESRPGRGSVFSVALPKAAAAAAEPARTGRRPGRPALLDGTRVLCIDNERRILDGMEALLGGWGCAVLCAETAEQALTRLAGERFFPDVLLADYHLDDGDGLAAVSEIRRRLDADLPALLLTADRSPAVRDAARALGVEVLNKPIKPAALRALLAQWRVSRPAAE